MAKRHPEPPPRIPEQPRPRIPSPFDPPVDRAKAIRSAMRQIPPSAYVDAEGRASFAAYASVLYPHGVPIEESVVGEIVTASIGIDLGDDDWSEKRR